MRHHLLLAAALLLWSQSALATPVTWEFRGVVDTSSSSLASFFTTGDFATLRLTFDPEQASAIIPGATNVGYVYQHFGSGVPVDAFFLDASIGSHPYHTSTSGQSILYADSNVAGLFVDTSLSGQAIAGPAVGNWRPVALDVVANWTGLPSFATQHSPVLPASATNATFELALNDDRFDFGFVRGRFTEVHAVPEPSTLTLLCLGGWVLLRKRAAGRRVN